MIKNKEQVAYKALSWFQKHLNIWETDVILKLFSIHSGNNYPRGEQCWVLWVTTNQQDTIHGGILNQMNGTSKMVTEKTQGEYKP